MAATESLHIVFLSKVVTNKPLDPGVRNVRRFIQWLYVLIITNITMVQTFEVTFDRSVVVKMVERTC